MSRTQTVGVGIVCVGLWLLPAAAVAQNAGIAGVVKDSSGAVMPGVTVEAESPVLIEKVRTVVTDAQGLYSIVDLRPGVYSVSFSLPGFSTIRREGVELTGSFTATANADLRVGAVEETLTVTGEAPTVDTRNVVQLQVMSDEVREALPTGRTVLFIATLIPGTTRTTTVGRPHDLAGTSDSRGASMIHGGRSADYQLTYDGTPTDLGGGGGSQSWQTNSGEIEEFVYQLGALSAERAFGGIGANLIPKEGGNRYVGQFFSAWSGERFQSDNLTQELEDLGVIRTVGLRKHWDVNFSTGGPIKRDRLWFFASYRNQGNDEEIVGNFEAIDPRSFAYDPAKGAAGNVDLSKPGIYLARNYFYSSRFTWQATARNKFALYVSSQPRHNYGFTASGTVAAESSRNQEFGNQLPGSGATCGRAEGCGPLVLHQGSWKSPVTSKLLIEANYGFNHMYGCRCVPFGDQAHLYAGSDVIAVVDSGTGYTYRSAASGYDFPSWKHDSAKVALSYVTGAHAAKFGFDADWGGSGTEDMFHNQNMTFQFRNGVPTGITIFNEPWTDWNSFQRMGLFAQDQWTIRQLTVNAGVRLDVHKGSVPGWQTTGPNAFAPLTRYPAIENVPNWKDLSPRFGVAYDLFGDGRTALKYTLSRYVVNDGTAFPQSVNPITFNRSATRPWNDRRAVPGGIPNDNIPQPAELGSLSNSAFGTTATTTTVDDAIREGWHVRLNNWETSASVQHQLMPQLSVSFAFTRRWFNNFTVTDNLALTPADYDEFCITAPTDARLGAVSGTQICGLYDLNPAKRTVTPNNFRTGVEEGTYGTQSEYWQGIDLNFAARLPRRATVQGGVNVGPSGGNNTEACFVVDSPGARRFCDVNRPWRSNVRLLGSFELPWGISTGVTFVADPGAADIQANYTVRDSDIGSIVQFKSPARTSFGGGSAAVALLEPGQQYNDYLYQVDVRLGKVFEFRGLRARLTLDLANLTNTAQVFTHSTTYGTSWLRPIFVLQGRLVKPGVTIEF